MVRNEPSGVSPRSDNGRKHVHRNCAEIANLRSISVCEDTKGGSTSLDEERKSHFLLFVFLLASLPGRFYESRESQMNTGEWQITTKQTNDRQRHQPRMYLHCPFHLSQMPFLPFLPSHVPPWHGILSCRCDFLWCSIWCPFSCPRSQTSGPWTSSLSWL